MGVYSIVSNKRVSESFPKAYEKMKKSDIEIHTTKDLCLFFQSNNITIKDLPEVSNIDDDVAMNASDEILINAFTELESRL